MVERKFRNVLTVGAVEAMGLTIGELTNLNVQNLKISQAVALINEMMIEGDKITKETDVREIFELATQAFESFLADSRQETTKNDIKKPPNHSPAP